MVFGPSEQLSRRTMIATIGAAAATLLTNRAVCSADLALQRSFAQGYVVNTASTVGRLGIPNVMVSNGREVTLTNASGWWSLAVEPGDSVFVIKPAQWAYAKASGIPELSYLHQPDGTPKHLRLQGPTIEPTGPLGPSINFYLAPVAEPEDFDVLLVADTQAENSTELEFVRQDLQSLTKRISARLAISHGDIMGDDLGLLPAYRTLLDDTGMIWHHCPGNHDLNLDSRDPRFACEGWKQFIGPTHYAFQHAGATFILLNNVEFAGSESPPTSGKLYRGYISDRQLTFVRNVLRHVPDEDLVVVSMHIPLVSFEAPDCPANTTLNRRALLEILSTRPNTVSFSGHSHTTEHHYLGAEHGFSRETPHHHHVLTAFCGSWWSGPHDQRGIPISDSRDGSPRGYHILTVRGNAYTTTFLPLPECVPRDLRVIKHSTDMGSCLLVDVFDGGPRTEVRCEISGVAEIRFDFQRTRMKDPHIVEVFAQNRRQMKPWVEASVSSHLWLAPIPDDLAPGEYSCSICVKTEYGDYQRHAYALSIRGPA
jgi:hypothetical protein